MEATVEVFMLKDNRIVIRLCDTCESIIDDKVRHLTLKIKGDKEENTRISFSLKDDIGEREIDLRHDLHFCSTDCICEFFNFYNYRLENMEKTDE